MFNLSKVTELYTYIMFSCIFARHVLWIKGAYQF